MHDAHAFLQNVPLVLCVAAVTTVLCQRVRRLVARSPGSLLSRRRRRKTLGVGTEKDAQGPSAQVDAARTVECARALN
jgi:hypothetical protein